MKNPFHPAIYHCDVNYQCSLSNLGASTRNIPTPDHEPNFDSGAQSFGRPLSCQDPIPAPKPTKFEEEGNWMKMEPIMPKFYIKGTSGANLRAE